MIDFSYGGVLAAIALMIGFVVGYLIPSRLSLGIISVFDRLFLVAGSKLNKKQRGMAALFLRGGIFIMFILFCVSLVLGAVVYVLQTYSFGIPTLSGLLLCTISSLISYIVIGNFGENKARALCLLGINPSKTDDAGAYRNYIEAGVFIFSSVIIGSIFWFLVLGVYGAILSFIFSWFYFRFCLFEHSTAYNLFGRFVFRVLNFFPSIVASILFIVSSLFVPKVSTFSIIKPFLFKRWIDPEAVVASIMNVTLGGVVAKLDGESVKRKWVDVRGSSARLLEHHIKQFRYVIVISYILLVLSLCLAVFPLYL